jgi:hypothetical protein
VHQTPWTAYPKMYVPVQDALSQGFSVIFARRQLDRSGKVSIKASDALDSGKAITEGNAATSTRPRSRLPYAGSHSSFFLVNPVNFIDCTRVGSTPESATNKGKQGKPMLVDIRRYTVYPGMLKAYLEIYETCGLPVQRRHVGEPLGYFISEVGELNQVVHLWGYEDAADRQRRRAAMEKDPDWVEYKRKTAAGQYIQRQENQLVVSAPWSRL